MYSKASGFIVYLICTSKLEQIQHQYYVKLFFQSECDWGCIHVFRQPMMQQIRYTSDFLNSFMLLNFKLIEMLQNQDKEFQFTPSLILDHLWLIILPPTPPINTHTHMHIHTHVHTHTHTHTCDHSESLESKQQTACHLMPKYSSWFPRTRMIIKIRKCPLMKIFFNLQILYKLHKFSQYLFIVCFS